MTKLAKLLALLTLIACSSDNKDDETGTEATTGSETDPTE